MALLTKKIIAARNIYTSNGQTSTLTITNRRGESEAFLIDTSCLAVCQTYCWRLERGYPVASDAETGKVIVLPRLLRGLTDEDDQRVKYANGNNLDLRLQNLRVGQRPAAALKTRKNSTGFTGVHKRNWRDATGRKRPYQAWTAGKPRQSLGHFATAEAAAEARAEWIRKTGWTEKTRGRNTGWRKKRQAV